MNAPHVQLPSAETLRSLFNYDPEQGHLTHKRSRGRCRQGQVVGSMNDGGLLRTKVKGHHFYVHRIIWAIQTGDDPGNTSVTHRNGVLHDNAWKNLQRK